MKKKGGGEYIFSIQIRGNLCLEIALVFGNHLDLFLCNSRHFLSL